MIYENMATTKNKKELSPEELEKKRKKERKII